MTRFMVGTVPTSAAFALALFVSLGGAAHSEGACFPSLSECPAIGCATAGTADALLNQIKRRRPRGDRPIRLTIDDFIALQEEAERRVRQNRELSKEERDRLRGLPLNDGTREASEGDLVELAGFLTGLPDRPNAAGPESVNCRLTRQANNDFHIPIAGNAGDSEFEGIVVEMIPQGRPSGWTVPKLKRIGREGRMVVVRGQLFYDNEHRVNDNPHRVLHGEPKRVSLWEIHPVTEFFVCMTANRHCNPRNVRTQQWKKLEAVRE